jgi:hypothetical protein
MDKAFDIFEVLSDGSIVWRAGGICLGPAQVAILEYGQKSSNHFFVMHVPTKEIVAQEYRKIKINGVV